MTYARRHDRRLVRALPAAGALLLLAYFGYHAFHGNYGLFAYGRLSQQAQALQADAAALKADRRALEARVGLMRPDQLDVDWLDEEARRSLGYLHPNDVVVIRPDQR